MIKSTYKYKHTNIFVLLNLVKKNQTFSVMWVYEIGNKILPIIMMIIQKSGTSFMVKIGIILQK